MELSKEDLHASVSDPVAGTMNFLNEVSSRFPDAISLAAGRPYEFYTADDIPRYLGVFVDHLRSSGLGEAEIRRWLTQYGRTNGQIGDLVARQLAIDEDIHVAPEAIAVTVGCQEAMVLAIRGLCAGPRDVLLAVEPTYVGITGAARLLNVPVVPVPEDRHGVDPATLTAVARGAKARGERPRAFYVIPNFANPSGISLDVATREKLVAVAAAEELVILEDDPYGLFGLDAAVRPSLKSLDRDGQVIYLGSFAKSCFPGPRVGFLVADQPVVDRAGRRTTLAEELSTVKSMLTVNTSPIAQAVVGGLLVEAGCGLRAANKAKIEFYRRNMSVLLSTLAEVFPVGCGVRWNSPDGGFFAVVEVPVRVDEELLERSARDYGVLWTPMSFFYAGTGGEHALRLSASYLAADRITEGVRRLARLIKDVTAS